MPRTKSSEASILVYEPRSNWDSEAIVCTRESDSGGSNPKLLVCTT